MWGKHKLDSRRSSNRLNDTRKITCLLVFILFESCLTVHLPHVIMWNANLMQQDNFIDEFLARHVSGTYAHHQEH